MRTPTTGRVLVKTRESACPAPAHLDVLAGAARLAGTLDAGGPIDRSVRRRVSAMRVRRVFHARERFNRPGERGTAFADDERELGLDRVYALELAEPSRAEDVARELRGLDAVQWAIPEHLSIVPLDVAPLSARTRPDREMIDGPRRLVHADEALAMEPGSNAIVAGVIDTGVSLHHEEFTGRCFGGYDTVDLGMGRIGEDLELVGDSRGRDFSPADETGHGSHVAGIIAANGVHVPRGLGGAVRLAPVRALAAARDASGRIVGIGGTLDLDAAIKAATELGCHVINMSFGTPEIAVDGDVTELHADATAYATSRGAVLVSAIGNSGQRERYYPAALDDVIAVGSVDNEARPSAFSTRGAHCELAAPGENIVSVGLQGYRASTGTSHAAPYVTATIALMLARAARAEQTLDTATCRTILADTVQPHDGDPEAVGAGVLDASAALRGTDHVLQQRKDQDRA